MQRIGFPRALLFYEYYPFWRTFFEELGASVIISDTTTKSIMNIGVKNSVDEACLPIKIFHGHIINLCGKVDYIFIPRLTSVAENEYICPKFGGLPDMIRSSIPELPKIISTEINARSSYQKVINAIKEIGSYFTNDKSKIIKAYSLATKAHLNYRKQFRNGIPDWISKENNKTFETDQHDFLNVGILGHPYNTYDSYINMNIISKLNKNKVNIITPEMLNEEIVNQRAQMLKKKLFWTFGRRIFGSAMYMMEMKNLHGIIYIMSFGCGLDSFVCDMVERRARAAGVPFSVFVLDEHTGEAGINTRIEAFIDMIRWRDKNENYISTYG